MIHISSLIYNLNVTVTENYIRISDSGEDQPLYLWMNKEEQMKLANTIIAHYEKPLTAMSDQ